MFLGVGVETFSQPVLPIAVTLLRHPTAPFARKGSVLLDLYALITFQHVYRGGSVGITSFAAVRGKIAIALRPTWWPRIVAGSIGRRTQRTRFRPIRANIAFKDALLDDRMSSASAEPNRMMNKTQ